MEIKQIVALDKSYFNANQNANIGLYIIGVGVLSVIANFLGWSYDTQILQGIVIGGGIVYWGVNFDKKQRLKRELDEICLTRYGKNHKESFIEIINESNSSKYQKG